MYSAKLTAQTIIPLERFVALRARYGLKLELRETNARRKVSSEIRRNASIDTLCRIVSTDSVFSTTRRADGSAARLISAAWVSLVPLISSGSALSLPRIISAFRFRNRDAYFIPLQIAPELESRISALLSAPVSRARVNERPRLIPPARR